MRAVLNGQIDAQGDKYVLPLAEPAGTTLYWIGPVRSDPKTIMGAVLVGESLTEIADSIRDSRASDLVFYDSSGRVLLSSLSGAPSLTPSVVAQLGQGPVRISQEIDHHPYQFLVGNWRLRNSPIGYLAAAERADSVEASVAQLRWLMVL